MTFLAFIARFPSFFIYPFQFKYFGKKSKIVAPLKLDGKKNIEIGSRVYINYKTWLLSLPLTDCHSPLLKISDGCVIGNYNHICATQSVIFENDVLTADKVYVADNLHYFENINIPIHKQPVRQTNTVTIGEGSWLGENVCVIGANIGKHCVIGANAVVTHDIPDYSVAVGVPAKVIKHYDFETKQWVSVKN
jgi:acetyltransferase-like isoleucine patch superfamily enzyme